MVCIPGSLVKYDLPNRVVRQCRKEVRGLVINDSYALIG